MNDLDKTGKSGSRFLGMFGTGLLLYFLVWLGLAVGVVCVAVHFIAKLW